MQDTGESSTETVAFILNGQAVSATVEPGETLLEMLRERFGITSPKNGCAPQAACGCCTVLLDGRPRRSCALPATRAAGSVSRWSPPRGLPEDVREQISECFVRAGAVQCGFCTPGIVMRTVALVEQHPSPTREQVAEALENHLCRCTGYTKIIDARPDVRGRPPRATRARSRHHRHRRGLDWTAMQPARPPWASDTLLTTCDSRACCSRRRGSAITRGRPCAASTLRRLKRWTASCGSSPPPTCRASDTSG